MHKHGLNANAKQYNLNANNNILNPSLFLMRGERGTYIYQLAMCLPGQGQCTINLIMLTFYQANVRALSSDQTGSKGDANLLTFLSMFSSVCS